MVSKSANAAEVQIMGCFQQPNTTHLLLTRTSGHTIALTIAWPASEDDWGIKLFGAVLPTMSSSGPAATAKLRELQMYQKGALITQLLSHDLTTV